MPEDFGEPASRFSRFRHRSRCVSGEANLIPASDDAASDDGRVHTHVYPVMFRRSPQDAAVLGQITLRECRHDAARAGSGHLDANLSAKSEDLADPSVLDEAAGEVCGLDNEVRPEAPGLKASFGIQLSQPIQGRRRQDVKDGQIEECVGGHGFVRDLLPMGQALDVGPILFEARLLGCGASDMYGPFEILG